MPPRHQNQQVVDSNAAAELFIHEEFQRTANQLYQFQHDPCGVTIKNNMLAINSVCIIGC